MRASRYYDLHYIKPLKHKEGRYLGSKGFDEIVVALGSNQIPVCRSCHQNIHSGKSDGLSLHDLYDVRRAAPESLLRISATPTEPLGKNPRKISPRVAITKVRRKNRPSSLLTKTLELISREA